MTKSITAVSTIFPIVFLSACSSGDGFQSGPGIDPGFTPEAEIVTLNPDGSVPDQGFSGIGTNGDIEVFRNETGDRFGFRYQYGRVANSTRFRGVAGILPASDPGAVPTTATATYDAQYDLTYVGNDVDRQSGNIALNADFNAGTVTGNAGGFAVNGTVTGTDLGGTASYRGVQADMRGVIGDRRVVGAFAGENANALLVGGLIGTPRTTP
ncbi:MAG: hypothetical protein AAGG57_06725 [Pseudomonadota bacterium]